MTSLASVLSAQEELDAGDLKRAATARTQAQTSAKAAAPVQFAVQFAGWALKRSSIRKVWRRRYFVLRTRLASDARSSRSPWRSGPSDSRFQDASHVLLYFQSPAFARDFLHHDLGSPAGAIPVSLGITSVEYVQLTDPHCPLPMPSSAVLEDGNTQPQMATKCLMITTPEVNRKYFIIPEGRFDMWIRSLTVLDTLGFSDPVKDVIKLSNSSSPSETWQEASESLRSILVSKRCRHDRHDAADVNDSNEGTSRRLRNQILCILDAQKEQLFRDILLDMHPEFTVEEQGQGRTDSQDLYRSVSNWYRNALTNDLGLSQKEGDKDLSLGPEGMPQTDPVRFATVFRKMFSIVDFINAIVSNVNSQPFHNDKSIEDSRQSIDPSILIKWASPENLLLNNGFDSVSIYYNEDHKLEYNFEDKSDEHDFPEAILNHTHPCLRQRVVVDLLQKLLFAVKH